MADRNNRAEDVVVPAFFGAIIGVVLAVIAYFPMVVMLQNVFDVPEPTATPKKYRGDTEPISPGYWITWMVPVLVAIPAGLVLSWWRRRRVFALAATFTFVLGAAAVAAVVISFELNGFAPD
ncbi:hypothetical protein NN3_09880 [Nocardia neocaledoniensis NBRC 108232]|uniref:Uncharacterized protein n=1 Tax=Nocardia neocaledoniensis TaxID=236511 RepID=A0A317NF30_9NOCA|nr:hypothetical protein [Nocardia neocaledoniensis]PWV73424.1 hypothetical protein DFR69_10750 [Nocardia neocaledoniensis]GEM29981.1 hypothetical protein NN3_09880 [Nocardia neocaledoniensis NBRC 108232]